MLEILVDPEKLSERALCESGSGHVPALEERGWLKLDNLDKDVARRLGALLGLKFGPATMAPAMAHSIRDELMNPRGLPPLVSPAAAETPGPPAESPKHSPPPDPPPPRRGNKVARGKK